jgi:hypothetical protein
MSKKKEEEVYQVTLKGLLYLTLEDNQLAQKVVDTLELYLRRHHAKGGHPGIVLNLDTNNFEFVTLKHSEDE